MEIVSLFFIHKWSVTNKDCNLFIIRLKSLDNRIKPRRCQIESVTFSAHVDYAQNKVLLYYCK